MNGITTHADKLHSSDLKDTTGSVHDIRECAEDDRKRNLSIKELKINISPECKKRFPDRSELFQIVPTVKIITKRRLIFCLTTQTGKVTLS